MNVWIEENYSNEDHEVVPLGDTCNSSLDLSGFSERYSICTKEFIQVHMTAEHLHKEHDITGGFTDNIEDCQKFIEAAGIKFIKDETFFGKTLILEPSPKLGVTKFNPEHSRTSSMYPPSRTICFCKMPKMSDKDFKELFEKRKASVPY